MAVVFIDHSCVRMTKVRANYWERHSAHDQVRGVSVSQYMETYWWLDIGPLAGFPEGTVLMGFSPGPPVSMREQSLVALTASRNSLNELLPFVGENHIA